MNLIEQEKLHLTKLVDIQSKMYKWNKKYIEVFHNMVNIQTIKYIETILSEFGCLQVPPYMLLIK